MKHPLEVELNHFILTMSDLAAATRENSTKEPSFGHLREWFRSVDVNLHDPVVRRTVWAVIAAMGSTDSVDEKTILAWSLFLTSLDRKEP
jgi:hypothetical protein